MPSSFSFEPWLGDRDFPPEDPLRDGRLCEIYSLSGNHHPGRPHDKGDAVGDLHGCLFEQRCTLHLAAGHLGSGYVS